MAGLNKVSSPNITEMKWPNGQVSARITTNDNGSKKLEMWYDNGSLTHKVDYDSNDKRHGDSIWWHQNGQMKSFEVFNHGIIISERFWNDAGILREKPKD